MQQNDRPQILVLGPDEAACTLAGRLSLIGAGRGIRAADVETALRARATASLPFAVGFVFSDHGLDDLPKALRALGETGGDVAMPWIVFGPPPAAAERTRLREAGAHFALFDPTSDEELRFVVNEARYASAPALPRLEHRVPADLPARIYAKNGEKVAVVYNLSVTGAYVATPRPTLRGGSVRLSFSLPGGEASLVANVVWNNVPGNLRRFHAPIGMGLRFTETPHDVMNELSNWVANRTRSYRC
jgi:hypothetical protein